MLLFQRENVQSILVVPIILEKGFWGFIELHHCQLEKQWTQQDESIVFAMAASISAALHRQKAETIIHHQAFHDPLTGLPNRILFAEHLQLALDEALHSQVHVCVMFIDLDRFKRINDTLGHTVGDQMLCTLAKRLPTCLPDGACLARWGGDEFTLLLPQIDSEQEAIEVAEYILQAIKLPFSIASQTLFVGASIGISCSPIAGMTAETLLQNADVALYRCKEQTASGYQLYDPSMNAKAPELFMLENSFHDGLKNNEFVLYYQPKFNIITHEIVGLEALIRWHHPTMGLVSPALFIPIAEETGFIAKIGTWVLETACHQLVDWHRQGFLPLSMSVNLSAQQFYQPSLLADLAMVLQRTKVSPETLELEITETVTVANVELTIQLLQQVQDMGIRIAMDDFGTGYSSLNYLKQLPLDTLKIDQSFIRDLKPHTKDQEIVRAVIALARGLELDIVAEGVDKEEQIDILQALDCNIVQGYYFSHPLTATQMTEMLLQNWLARDLGTPEGFLDDFSKLSIQQFTIKLLLNYLPACMTSTRPYWSVSIQDNQESLIEIPIQDFAAASVHDYQKLGAPYEDLSPYAVRKSVLEALYRAQSYLQRQSPHWRLYIFDAYRPLAVQQFMANHAYQFLLKDRGLNGDHLNGQAKEALWQEVYSIWAPPNQNPLTPPPHSTGAAVGSNHF